MSRIMNCSIITIVLLVLILHVNMSFAGYGDCIDTLPSAFEREVQVMTNAVRMDPVGFRNLYIAGTTILLPQNYPAVAPLWYSQALSRAARFHSVDMAMNCGMQHESCNGELFQARLKRFYTGSSWIGENIATGKTTGLQTVIQWLRDDVRQGSSYVPANDNSDNDGHRKNIMSSKYKEIGVGYAYNAMRDYRYFWTEDFGGGTVATSHKIPAGCHFTPNSSTISYAANYYDPNGEAPLSADVVIDGTRYPMRLHLGSGNKGTYVYTTSQDKKEHCYHFVFTDGNNQQIRFPETVPLTTGTARCCDGENSLVIPRRLSGVHRQMKQTAESPELHYLLNGMKVTGKLKMHYSSGLSVSETTKKTSPLKKEITRSY